MSEATSPRLTAQHVSIIQEHPIPSDIRAGMRNAIGESAEDLSDRKLNAVVWTLRDLRAAHLLSWPSSVDKFDQGLEKLDVQFVSGVLRADEAMDLAHSIFTGTDQDIWQAVLTLIYKHVRATDTRFSSIVDTTHNSTPSKTKSNSLPPRADSKTIEAALFKEIADCTYQGVGGFFPRFFDRSNWGEDEKYMLDQLLSRHDGRRWLDFPAETTEENISAWLLGLQESCLRTRLGRPARNLLKTNKVIHGQGKQEAQMDMFFESSSADATHDFAAVLVASELKRTHYSQRFKERLLQLLRYVRRVFYDQPLRYYVHAFLLSGSVMEAWVVDRSGPISSGDFDINDNPDLFAGILVSYATMGPADMGLNTFVKTDDDKVSSVNLALTPSTGAGQGALGSVAEGRKKYELLELVDKRKAIVCRGTTCYLTSDGRVVKFAWTSDKRPSEFSHLQCAKSRGVTGVATAEACEQITSVDELRAGLISPGPFRYRSSDAPAPSPARASPDIRKRTYEEAESLTRQATDRKWENKVLTCMAICPAGRVLSDFRTVKELIEAMLDAIRAHRSLLVKGNILHRDVSPHNIIITEPGENNPEGFRGMLIDLDMAKEQDAELSGAPHVTGTLPYMSIAVLLGKPHSCRDDLESFLYTLMRLCGLQAWINVLGTEPPSLGKLVNWGAAKPAEDLSALKEVVMTNRGRFEKLMEDEFPKVANIEAVKSLCEKVRSILFTGYNDEETLPRDPEYLYSSIIKAFEETVQGLAEHSSAVSPIGSASADVGQSTALRRSARQRRNP